MARTSVLNNCFIAHLKVFAQNILEGYLACVYFVAIYTDSLQLIAGHLVIIQNYNSTE